MSEIKSFKDLEVWKHACALTKEIYEVTNGFPKEEQFGLTSQIRRAAVTVPSNIAEGCGRRGLKNSIKFFYIARGGLYEVETQIILAHELDFLDLKANEKLLEQVLFCKKLLNGFINYFRNVEPGKLNEAYESYINQANN